MKMQQVDMQQAKNKLESDRGASITFALLLFLVCAVISAVVITAATTAAGRMRDRAETDKRYYAVTSAIGVLRDSFNDTTITLTYEYENIDDVSIDTIDFLSINRGEEAPNTDEPKGLDIILVDATKQMIAIMVNEKNAAWTTKSFYLKVQNLSAQDCKISYNVEKDGLMTMSVSNTTGSGTDGKTYVLTAIFSSNINSIEYQNDHDPSSSKKSVTTTITWNLSDLKKGSI